VTSALQRAGYLSWWRMQVAAGLLRREGLSVGEVAARVGYESEPSFRSAFKRARGQPPSAYRRQFDRTQAR
jgi:AraC-like DNA-binding protein